MSTRTDLLTNAAATGAPQPVHPGGHYAWTAMATNWNGSELKLQIQIMSPDGAVSVYADIDGAVLTANGMKEVFLPAGASIKPVITNGAGAPTAVYSSLISR